MHKFKILDLFCGAGGFSYGMHQNSQFETCVALDNDPNVVATFKRNMPKTDIIIGDITDKSVKNDVIAKARMRGINMIIGGPPCQGYALKGKKLGLSDPQTICFENILTSLNRFNLMFLSLRTLKHYFQLRMDGFETKLLRRLVHWDMVWNMV